MGNLLKTIMGAEGMYVSRISSLPEAPDVPISSLNVTYHNFLIWEEKTEKIS